MKHEHVECPHCGEDHPYSYGKIRNEEGDMVASKKIVFYSCPKTDRTYLYSIGGKPLSTGIAEGSMVCIADEHELKDETDE